jgi:hypothetical protein
VTEPRICTLGTELDRAGQLCLCEDCGNIGYCTPRSDYYARPGRTGLCCEGCMRRSLAAHGIKRIVVTWDGVR